MFLGPLFFRFKNLTPRKTFVRNIIAVKIDNDIINIGYNSIQFKLFFSRIYLEHYAQRSRLSQVAGVRTRICRISSFNNWSLK